MKTKNTAYKKAWMEMGWDVIPRPILRMSEIGPSEKIIFIFILGRISEKGSGRAFPSVDSIAANTSLSERTVKTCISNLKEVGLISFERRGYGQSYEYQIEGIPDWILEKHGEFKNSKKNIEEKDETCNNCTTEVQNLPLSSAKSAPDFEKKSSQVTDGETTCGHHPPSEVDAVEVNALEVTLRAGAASPCQHTHSTDDLPSGAAQPPTTATATSPVARPPSEAQTVRASSVPSSRNGGTGMKVPGGRDEGDRPLKKKGGAAKGIYDPSKPVADWTCQDVVGYFRAKYEETYPGEIAPIWSLKGLTKIKLILESLRDAACGAVVMQQAIDYIFTAWKTKLGDRLKFTGARPSLAIIENECFFNPVVQEMQAGVKKKETDDYAGPSNIPRYKGWAGKPVTAADPMPPKAARG